MGKICELNHISKSYQKDGNDLHIFADFSLNLPGDEIIIFVGKSGCGKTTLLRMLCGLEEVDAGEIRFLKDDQEVQNLRFGMVFQDSRLFPWRTVLENVLIHQKVPNVTRGMELLKQMQLEGFENSYPNEISGGMAARVAIARALAFDADLLLMDEPFAALDYFTRQEMENQLIQLHLQQKVGVFFVTHDLDEAILLGEKIVVLKAGEPAECFPIELPYPRDLNDPSLQLLKKKLLELLA